MVPIVSWANNLYKLFQRTVGSLIGKYAVPIPGDGFFYPFIFDSSSITFSKTDSYCLLS